MAWNYWPGPQARWLHRMGAGAVLARTASGSAVRLLENRWDTDDFNGSCKNERKENEKSKA